MIGGGFAFAAREFFEDAAFGAGRHAGAVVGNGHAHFAPLRLGSRGFDLMHEGKSIRSVILH